MAKKSSGVQVYGLLDLKKAEARDLLTRVWYDDFKFWGCIYKVVQLMGKLEVKPADHNGKEGWGLFAGDRLIGTSKARFDADHAKAVLERWADDGYARPMGYWPLAYRNSEKECSSS